MAISCQEILDCCNCHVRVRTLVQRVQRPGVNPLLTATDLLIAASVLVQSVNQEGETPGLSGLDFGAFSDVDHIARAILAFAKGGDA